MATDEHEGGADVRGVEEGGAALPPPAAVNAQLDRVSRSEAFKNSDRLVRLLRYLVERRVFGQRDHLKEYVVGTEVFGRPSSFDPRTDSIVRVEAHRLRSKLKLYYLMEGRDDPIVIELPRGTYVPELSVRESGGVARHTRRRRRARFGMSPATVGLTVALLVAVGVIGYLLRMDRGRGDAVATAVAVLPFLTASGDAGDASLSDGFVDELTTALAKVDGLRVVARTSAFQFQGKGQDLEEIGRKLHVGTVLEGSVRRVGSRLRISAQLVRIADASHLWAESFERDAGDLFPVQVEIVRGVAATLKVARLSAGDGRSPQPPPVSAAYDLYLRGRAFRSQGTPDGVAKSAAFFEASVAADSSYAPAYAALADAHATLAFHGLDPPAEAIERARRAVHAALRLDDSSAEAHLALARIRFTYDWDWPAAEREFEIALRLNQNNARAHAWYGIALATRGRFDAAVTEGRTALELDPLSMVAAGDLAGLLYFARRYDEALEQAQRVLTMHPKATSIHALAAECLVAKRRLPEAIAEFKKAIDPSERFSLVLGRLGRVYALAGRKAEALEVLKQIETTQMRSGTPNVEMAFVHTGLGDKDRAFACLEQALAEREAELLFLNVAPVFDTLRSDPRFRVIARKLGLQ